MTSNHLKFLQIVIVAMSFVVSAIARAGDPFERLGEGKQPQVIVNGEKVFIVYGGPKNQILFQQTGQLGYHVITVAEPPYLALGMRRGPRIAVSKNALTIAAITGENEGGKAGDVRAWRSTDDGKSWNALAKPLNSVPGAAREGLHALAGGPDGLMACVWLDLRNVKDGKPGTEIWGAISHDAGATWSDDAAIYRSPDKTVCQCCHPCVAIDSKGEIAVMFRNALDGNRDMYVARSTDLGKSFGKAVKIGEKSWPLDACPMDGGSIAMGKSAVTVWRRGDEIFEATIGTPEKLIGKGQQPCIAEDAGGERFILWITGRPGDLMIKSGDGKPTK